MDGATPVVRAEQTADAETSPVSAESVKPLRKVLINDLEVVASIGVYEHEHRYLQRVIVSMTLWVSDTYDGRTDELGDVYDYDEAVGAARDILDDGHVNLIETAAEQIAARCLRNPMVHKLALRMEKPDAIPGCRSVGVEIERSRS